jgi:hypothetical protein
VLRIGLARGPSLLERFDADVGVDFAFRRRAVSEKTVVTHRFKLKGLAIFGVRSGELMVVPTLFQEMPSEWQR